MTRYCILGNCQANALASTLQACAFFKNNYFFEKFTPIHRISAEEHSRFLSEFLPSIDLFLYQPISDKFRGEFFGYKKAISSVSRNALCLSFPSIQFYGYHSTAKTLPQLPVFARDLSRNIFGLPGSELFHYSQIVFSFLKGLSEREAAILFHQGFPDDFEFIRKRFAESMGQLKRSEVEFDLNIRIHDFILDNFKEMNLFWTPRHPVGFVLAKIASDVLNSVGVDGALHDFDRLVARDPLKLPRYPLQEVVVQALGLRFSPSTEFRSRTVTMSVFDMISGYYEVYRSVGAEALYEAAKVSFPGYKLDASR